MTQEHLDKMGVNEMDLGNVLNYSDQNLNSKITAKTNTKGENDNNVNVNNNDNDNNKSTTNINKIAKPKSKRSRMTLSCVVCRKRKVKVSFLFKNIMVLNPICLIIKLSLEILTFFLLIFIFLKK